MADGAPAQQRQQRQQQQQQHQQLQTQQLQTQQQGPGPVLLGRTSSNFSYVRQASKPLPLWLCRLTSCLGLGAQQAGSKKSEEDEADYEEEERMSKVRIDKSTEVPEELYFALVEAGRKARARGQHRKAARRIVLSAPPTPSAPGSASMSMRKSLSR